MTMTEPTPVRPGNQPVERFRPPPHHRGSRWPLVILLIVSLVGAGATRQWAAEKRSRSAAIGSGAASPLSRMNSFALALLLGGLRGPLVMVLWTSSESQKQDRDLEDFDTKVEWIRLLQPEFDTVHIFQIWNKAYNISVFKASLANKYLTILDALNYARNVNAERPDDINIVYAIGGVFFDKLGQSGEKNYYTRRVRAETQPHPSRQKLAPEDPAWRPLELDPIVDDKGYILPKYLEPTRTLLVDPLKPSEKYDGSELPFLKRWEPYPDGVSPLAVGYNYYKRAQLLQRIGKQRHAQLSDLVVDSRPALSLEFWSKEEWERAGRLELAALGKPVPADRLDLELPTAPVPVDVSLDAPQRAALEHSISVYKLAGRLASDSIAGFDEHLSSFQQNIDTYRSHLEELDAEGSLMSADADYLSAILGDADVRRAMLARAVVEYRDALAKYELIVFRHYVPQEIAQQVFPPGFNQNNVENLPAPVYEPMIQVIRHLVYETAPHRVETQDDLDEYFRYIDRAQARLKAMPH